MLLCLAVPSDNVCTSYHVFSVRSLAVLITGVWVKVKSGDICGDRSPKTGTVPANRGRLVFVFAIDADVIWQYLLLAFPPGEH